MPEGHTVHRIALQFARHFVGHEVAASSPQGRFSEGATEIDGQRMVSASAIGKQLFLGFDNDRILRVHLGLYGAWEFAGQITVGAARRRTGLKSKAEVPEDLPPMAADGEELLASMGAPRVARLRMAEQEKLTSLVDFPHEPVGAVRVRLLTDTAVADLRGPTACVVLDPSQAAEAIAKLGPDPINDPPKKSENLFAATVLKKPTPIGLLLMDQHVVSGIGNVYRAELLFRARLNPHTPGREVPEAAVRALWKDWTRLLKSGVELGQMVTVDRSGDEPHRTALTRRSERNYVYHRTGLPCRVCGEHILMEQFGGRKLYWCPFCQA